MGDTLDPVPLDAELLVLQEAAKLVGQASDPGIAIPGMLRLLSELIGLDRGRVLLHHAQCNALPIAYAYGLTQAEHAHGAHRADAEVARRVLRTGTPEVVQEMDGEEVGCPLPSAIGSMRSRETIAYLAVPILAGDRAIGVLVCHRLRHRGRALQRDINLLRIVATLISQVLRLERRVEPQTAALRSETRQLRYRLARRGSAFGILGDSAELRRALGQAERVAVTQTTVLVPGRDR